MERPTKPDTELYVFDPLRSETAWLLPQLANRILLFSKTVDKRTDAAVWTRRILARMVLGDPFVRCLVFVQGEDIVAHGLAEIAEVDGERTLFVLQLEVDPGASTVVDKIVQEADNWGRSMNIKSMRTEVIPTLPEKVWLRLFKRHKWRLVSRVMERELQNGKQEG